MQHSEHCKGVAPRTHDEVMATMREMRVLAGKERSKTAIKTLCTETGIHSQYAASEHILRDMVKDSTIDVMHVFLCGLTRYLWSWVTDELIPRDFSWEELNKENKKYPYKRGVRIPTLERSKGDKRCSCSAKKPQRG